jgi:hypothetical protein
VLISALFDAISVDAQRIAAVCAELSLLTVVAEVEHDVTRSSTRTTLCGDIEFDHPLGDETANTTHSENIVTVQKRQGRTHPLSVNEEARQYI